MKMHQFESRNRSKRLLAHCVAALAGTLGLASASATPVNYNGASFDVLVTNVDSATNTYTFRYTADFTSSAWLSWRASNSATSLEAVGFGISGYDALSVALLGTNATVNGAGWTAGEGTINNSPGPGCTLSSNGQGPCAFASSSTAVPTTGAYYWDFAATFYSNTGNCQEGSTAAATGSGASSSSPNKNKKQAQVQSQPTKPACTAETVPDLALTNSTNPIRANFYPQNIMSLAGPFTMCLDGDCDQPCYEGNCDQKVPEPGTLALLGLGLLGLGATRRPSRG